MMEGKILAVCISESKGERKRPVPWITLQKDHGVSGDAHAGDWHRQVSLLANESIEKMRALGLSVSAGDFAENITTIGINLVVLPVGSRLQIGAALLEVTQIGKECHTRCAIYHQAGDCVMPKEGIFARVLHGGEIKPGARISVVVPEIPVTREKKARSRGKYKLPQKPYVVSLRISDDEMKQIRELMQVTNKAASELLREAFHLFKTEIAQTLTASAA
jgi:MOSC domain-containing protein YiiM